MNRRAIALSAIVVLAIAACDDDPTRPIAALNVVGGCPTISSVDAPISLQFSSPLNAATVSGSNILVSDAATGNEIPGTVSLVNTATGATVTFTPSASLPFGDTLRIRVQNLLSDSLNVPLSNSPFVCNLVTPPPPITQLYWDVLPRASGTLLNGAALVAPDSGFVISDLSPIYRRQASDFVVSFQDPYYVRGWDVTCVSRLRCFGSHLDFRTSRNYVTETLDAGITWDTLTSVANTNIFKLFMRNTGAALPNDVFGVGGAGSAGVAIFLKYRPNTRTYTQQLFTNTTGAVRDVSFAPGDTTVGVAVTAGSRLITPNRFGKVYRTPDGGVTWVEQVIAGLSPAPLEVVGYKGVARRANGEVIVVGGSGFVAKLTPSGATYTFTRKLENALTQFDPTNFQSLIYNDVEFAPDNDLRGWIVGAQQIGVVNGVPRYQGVIFETTDGGNTWTRQGVRGAPNFGAEFPRLERISVLNSNNVWLVGEDGAVLQYQP